MALLRDLVQIERAMFSLGSVSTDKRKIFGERHFCAHRATLERKIYEAGKLAKART